MKDLVETLRRSWNFMLSVPGRGNSKAMWGQYLVYWAWAIVGTVPGVLLAAASIEKFRITDQIQQEILSVVLAIGTSIFVQAFVMGMLAIVEAIPNTHRFPTHKMNVVANEILALFVLIPLTAIAILGPIVLAGGATYWYFTHPSESANVAVAGAGGAVVLKVLLTLVNVILIPPIKNAITSMFTRGFWQWLRDKDGEQGET